MRNRSANDHGTESIMRQNVWFYRAKGMVLNGKRYGFGKRNHTFYYTKEILSRTLLKCIAVAEDA